MTAGADWFTDRIRSFGDVPALAHGSRIIAYEALARQIDETTDMLVERGLRQGAVVAFDGDFSPEGIALFFALARVGCVIVPLGTTPPAETASRLTLGEVEWVVSYDEDRAAFDVTETGITASHPLLRDLAATGHPGLMLFSSGSSGPPKAAVHDLEPLFEKFKTPRPAMRTAGFLLFDHIGGLNTMWHVLSNGGLFACLPDRSGDAVAATIARHGLELLPTSPTFINLLLVSGAIERHDMRTLKVITYGTEPMPESTLHRIHTALPTVQLRQTYGLSELGILRAKSEGSDSLWVKIGGEGYETRIVDGILHIKARSAMLGYLNADAPFDADGWFNTNDLVEVRGDYFRILGRVSDVVNVGGQKVHPSEVESVILELDAISQVAVEGEPNALLGNIVVAYVVAADPTDAADLRSLVRAHCRARLPAFKVPAKVVVVAEPLHSQRFKKRTSSGKAR